MSYKETVISALYKSSQTVFTSKEIALLIGETNPAGLKAKLSYFVRTGKIVRLRRGVFAKPGVFEMKECAVRLYTPSYISFETVLAKQGVIFQYDETIFTASYLSRRIQFGEVSLAYRKIKDEALLNRRGIIDRGTFFEASRERAFLDTLYLSGSYHFDNLRRLDWQECFALVSLYKKKSLERSLHEYYKLYA